MGYGGKFTKLACALLMVSLLLFFTAYVSKGWVTQTEQREIKDNITDLSMGLWQTCFYDNHQQKTICHTTDRFLLEDWNEAWLPGVQTIFSTVLALQVLSFSVTLPFLILSYPCSEGTLMIFVATCSSFATFALLFLGILIFGIQQGSDTVNFYDTSLDWAYGLTVVATAFTGVACFLLVGEFYDILMVLARKKSLRKQEQRVMEALDEATIATRNTARKYSLNPPTENTNQQPDNASIDSRSPLCKQTGNHDNKNILAQSSSTGITNPTYDSGGDGIQYNDRGVRNRRSDAESQAHYINDGHRPSTSSDTHVSDNYLETTHHNKQSNHKPLYDSDISSSDDDDHDNAEKQISAEAKNNIYDMFNASNLQQPSQVEALKRSTTNKLPSVQQHRASSHQHPLNVNANNETSVKFNTRLPPLVSKSHLSRASYDNSVPTFSKSSKYYNTENQLTKSTPTDLFLTSFVKSQDLTSPCPGSTATDLFHNTKSQEQVTTSHRKSTPEDLFITDNSRSQEVGLSGAKPKKTTQRERTVAVGESAAKIDINDKYERNNIDNSSEVIKGTIDDYYNELSVAEKDFSKSKKHKKRHKSNDTDFRPKQNSSQVYDHGNEIYNHAQHHIYEELDEYSV